MAITARVEEFLQSLVEEREFQLSDVPVKVDEYITLTLGGRITMRCIHTDADDQPRGFSTIFYNDDGWSGLSTLWECKKLPDNKVLIRRNLRSLMPYECELLREHLQRFVAPS
jgi:hypothetical protein